MVGVNRVGGNGATIARVIGSSAAMCSPFLVPPTSTPNSKPRLIWLAESLLPHDRLQVGH
jgi:hypothetical protein